MNPSHTCGVKQPTRPYMHGSTSGLYFAAYQLLPPGCRLHADCTISPENWEKLFCRICIYIGSHRSAPAPQAQAVAGPELRLDPRKRLAAGRRLLGPRRQGDHPTVRRARPRLKLFAARRHTGLEAVPFRHPRRHLREGPPHTTTTLGQLSFALSLADMLCPSSASASASAAAASAARRPH